MPITFGEDEENQWMLFMAIYKLDLSILNLELHDNTQSND